MDLIVLIVLAVAWLVSPIVLGILLTISANKRSRDKTELDILRRRVDDLETMRSQMLQYIPPAEQAQFTTPAPPAAALPSLEPPVNPPIPTEPTSIPAAQPDLPALADDAPTPEISAAETVAPQIEQTAEASEDSSAVFAEPPILQQPTLLTDSEPEAAPPATVEKTSEFRPPSILKAPTPKPSQLKEEIKVSAISVMLSVGVALVILAGMLFVRTAWDSLTGTGRLAVLGAGSALFFGASAMAHKLWHLERTGTAFFILGSVFLPLSIWAAGCFDLLGKPLAGASNPWLLALSCGTFTVISLLAVRIYKKTSWGVLFLCGFTLTYSFAAIGIFDQLTPFGAALSALALAFCLFAEPLSKNLPAPIGKPLPIFSIAVAFLTIPLILAQWDDNYLVQGIAGFLAAACFLTPNSLRSLKPFASVPMCGMCIYAFARLGQPLLPDELHPAAYTVSSTELAILVCIVCALLMLLLVCSKALPDDSVSGFQAVYCIIAAVSIGISTLFALIEGDFHLLTVIASGLLPLIALVSAIRSTKPLMRGFLAAETSAFFSVLSFYLGTRLEISESNSTTLWLFGLFLAGGLLFRFVKPIRTTFSDFLFPICTLLFGYVCSDDFFHDNIAYFGVAAMAVTVPAFLHLAYEGGKRGCAQHVHALLSPIALFLTILALTENCPHPNIDSGVFTLIWSACAPLLGFLSYFTVKRGFNSVRKLTFAAFLIPPLYVGVFAPSLENDIYPVLLSALNACACAILWRIFSARGMRKLSTASFALMLILLCRGTAYLLVEFVFENDESPVMMFAFVWLLLAALAAIPVRRESLVFVGDYAVSATAGLLLPAAAVLLSLTLLDLPNSEWNALYLLYTLLFCAVGWFCTKRKNIILPTFCGISALCALESLRAHAFYGLSALSDSYIAIWIVSVTLLTALLCYLGFVLRETQPRRAVSMTITGGAAILWYCIAFDYMDFYATDAQSKWLKFMIPLLFAGFVFHFCFFTKKQNTRRTILTASAGLASIALWMQPFFSANGTYFEGKLHLLPLIAYGLLLRKLYGKKTGGAMLFGIGVYSMVRLGMLAADTEKTADLVTVLLLAVGLFVVSFFIKQKKWFLLGGSSLICIAVYLRIKVFPEIGWWVFLLLIGILLIVIAAANELCKQRGESLSVKAGRLWEDWDW